MTEAMLVFTTCANREEASRIARVVVEERLAACVQIVGDIQSVYHWQGAIEESREVLVLIKSLVASFEDLQARITGLHSYETPEIVAIPILAGAKDYLAWLAGSTQGAG